jgi:hypothetical protein
MRPAALPAAARFYMSIRQLSTRSVADEIGCNVQK